MKKYIVKQHNIKDCGVSCLASVIKYYKGNVSLEKLREMTKTDKNGTTAYHMKQALLQLGFNCKVVKCENCEITNEQVTIPCIAHVTIDNSYNHYVVIYNINHKKQQITIMDPNIGYKTFSFEEFYNIWSKILIVFYPTKEITNLKDPQSNFKFIKDLVSPHKKIILSIISLSLLFTIFNILNSFYFKYIIDNRNLNDFYLVSTIFLFVIIMKIITDYLRNYLLLYVNKKIDQTLFVNAIDHIISLPYNYYKNRTTGEVISRINDLSYIRDMISRVSITLFVDIFLAFFALVFLYILSSSLFFIALILLTIYIITIYVFNPILQKYIKTNIEQQAQMTSCLIESISAFETVKGLHLESNTKTNITKRYTNFINNVFSFNNLYNLQNTIQNTCSLIGTFLILFFGTIMVFNNQLSLGTLITYNALFLYFIEPIRNVLTLEPTIRQAYEAINRINELYTINSEKITAENNQPSLIGDIVFNHLSFSYNDYEYVLKDFNLRIKEKEKILIVGPSGCGKSTLMKLLLRYYEPNKNQLIINNQDVNNYNLDTLRNNISYVSQNELLFTDTIYNNIDLNRNIKEEQIEEVNKIALINDIIKSNPLGSHFLLEENGFNISGGERQRIILARALLKESNILILDESTSQIDLSNERTIFTNIFNKYSNKTIIVISHRKENSDLFDTVVNLKQKESE